MSWRVEEMRSQLMVLIVCVSVAVSPVIAASEEKDNWQFELAPFYLWAINIDGDLGVREKTVSSSISFNNVWDNLQGVVTTRFNALYRQQFGITIDYNYLDLGTEPATKIGDIEVGFTSHILNLAGTYRLMDGRHTLDGLAGIRYTKVESDISFRFLGITLDGNQDWVDPIVGLRYSYNFSDRWALRLYGDIGGFGVSSDFTWQAMGIIDFLAWENVRLVAGFRALGTDYASGSGTDEFTYDNTVYGPIAGIDIRW